MKKWIFKKQNSSRTRLRVILLAVFAFTFLVLASGLSAHALTPLDAGIYRFLASGSSDGLTAVMRGLSVCGSLYAFIPICAFFTLLFAIRRRGRYYGVMIPVNLIAVSLLNILLKLIFQRPRPDVLRLSYTYGYSFPSGHAMISAAFYGYLIYLSILWLKKPWKQAVTVSLLLLIGLIGVSRIYLGVHYASDVVGGLLAGCGWLILFITLSEAFAPTARDNASDFRKYR